MVWKSYCSNCLHLNTWWQERRWAFWHKSVEHEIDLWTSVSTRLYITAGSHHTNALLNVTIERFLTEKSWRTQSASTHPSMKHSWTDGCFLDDRESTSLQITETLTLQSLAYVQEEERKIWAADDCVWSSLSVIQHCVSPTSDRIYSRCSTRILWALGTVTQAEIDWVCASPSGLTFITEHQDSCYSLFCDSSTNDYWVVNLSKVSCKNDSIKISFCEFPKVIVCLKLLIYVL